MANYANLRYAKMVPEIQTVQRKLEGQFLALQPVIEDVGVALFRSDKARLRTFLTDYSVAHGELVTKRWRELGEYLVRKYNDGYVQDDNGRPRETGYPQSWLQRVLRERPRQFKLNRSEADVPESVLVD